MDGKTNSGYVHTMKYYGCWAGGREKRQKNVLEEQLKMPFKIVSGK